MIGNFERLEPHNRLRWAREQAGFATAKAFAEKAQIGEVTYRSYENGQSGFQKHALRFSKLLGVTTDWLLGDMNSTMEAGKPNSTTVHEPATSDLKWVRIKEFVIGVNVRKLAAQPSMTGAMPFNLEFLQDLNVDEPDSVFLCHSYGDSMAPTIRDGDLVMVDASRSQVKTQDEIWALVIAGCSMIKRLRPLPNNKALVLSDNVAFPHQTYNTSDITVVGKVIWISRRV